MLGIFNRSFFLSYTAIKRDSLVWEISRARTFFSLSCSARVLVTAAVSKSSFASACSSEHQLENRCRRRSEESESTSASWCCKKAKARVRSPQRRPARAKPNETKRPRSRPRLLARGTAAVVPQEAIRETQAVRCCSFLDPLEGSITKKIKKKELTSEINEKRTELP